MCANYTPSRRDELAAHFSVDPREYVFKPEAYPGYLAPIIRPSQERSNDGQLEVISAMFGMVPHWADTKLARQTYNSRTETTATKPSFRNAWKRRQFCVIPCESIFEPCYETGKPVRWEIRHRDGLPLGVAGIWEIKMGEAGKPPLLSFSMLTINADEHPLMCRFHKPEDEKRSVVVLHPDRYEAWLHADLKDAPDFFQPYPAEELTAAPAPRAAAGTKAGSNASIVADDTE